MVDWFLNCLVFRLLALLCLPHHKLSDWEGGVRVNAFVSGGFLPAAARGTKASGMLSIADWYSTFAGLAGVNGSHDPSAAAAGLPHVDSIDMWPMIRSGGANLCHKAAAESMG